MVSGVLSMLLLLSAQDNPALTRHPSERAADSAPGVVHAPAAGRPGAGALRLFRDTAAPLLTRRTAAIVLSGAALAGACTAFESPNRTARALDQPPWEQAADLGNVYGNGAVLGAGVLALYAAGSYTRDPNVRGAALDAVRSLGSAYAAVAVLKVSVARTRPDGGSFSFPSGHTAGAFAVAPVLARHFGRRVAVPAYALALMTGLGRLEDRRHYLSDVVFGATLGLASGLAYSQPAVSGVARMRVSLATDRAALCVSF